MIIKLCLNKDVTGCFCVLGKVTTSLLFFACPTIYSLRKKKSEVKIFGSYFIGS